MASISPLVRGPELFHALPPGQPRQPGIIQPGIIQPGIIQPGIIQPGIIQPGTVGRRVVDPVPVALVVCWLCQVSHAATK